MKSRHQDEVLTAGQLSVRTDDGLVLAGGCAVPLSIREYAVLVALMRRPGRIVSREDLYHAVWGGQLRKGDRSVDVYVHKLRAKLDAALPAWRHIHTHFGFGYRFAAEPFTPFSQGEHRSVTDSAGAA